ncbi:MAG: hypothetical protein ACLRMJ_05710 [Alistipes finegoldii]
MTEGGTMGDLYAYGDLRLDENGYIYINPNDLKLMVTDERIKLGSVLPDYNAGFRNDFSYKGINSLLFSARWRHRGIAHPGFLDGLSIEGERRCARRRRRAHQQRQDRRAALLRDRRSGTAALPLHLQRHERPPSETTSDIPSRRNGWATGSS